MHVQINKCQLYIRFMRDTFHTRSHANVERFSLWETPNKSYTCVLASLAQYKGTAALTGCCLELNLTWCKKYYLLSPNYTTTVFHSLSL